LNGVLRKERCDEIRMKRYDMFEIKISQEIATLILKGRKVNLFTDKMFDDLICFFRSLRENGRIRFLIIAGEGENFSGGMDLNEIEKVVHSPENARRQQMLGIELFRNLEGLEQITIAVLQGAVVGVGMAVAMVCDFRIMAEDSCIRFPEASIGDYLGFGCTSRLVRMVGASKAMEIIMTCDPIPASEALRLGLANKVVPKENLTEVVREFVEKLRLRSPVGLRVTKKLAIAASLEGLGNMIVCEPEFIQCLVYSGDLEEGIKAFRQKRPPAFRR
jgi:enoyl-CoA hydratase/carnithine racemase